MMWISLIILLSYIIYVIAEVGITPTLSESFYRVKYKWLFTLALYGAGFTLLPEWLNISEDFQFLAFFACAALCFIGASPAFKEGLSRKIHIGGLIVCIITLLLWCILHHLIWVPIIAATIGGLLSLKFKNVWGFIMEAAAFATAYIVIAISKYTI